MKKSVLQIRPLLPSLESALQQQYDIHRLWEIDDQDSFLQANGEKFAAVVTSAPVGVSDDLILKLPNLKVISSFGVGYDKINVPFAKERGIQVGYTPDVLNDCVADTAMGLVLNVARHFTNADRYVKEGQWPTGKFALGTKVSGKRLGILGLGRIGRAIAKRAEGFDMQIAYHNRNKIPASPYEYAESLLALAQWSDFLVIASSAGPENQKLVSREVIDALGPNGYLINISRGSVIDEDYLIQALKNNKIAGAGLDVFVDEPNVPAELRALDNVVLFPHIASATTETRAAMSNLVLENLHSFFATGTVAVSV
jgi:lactate dehydrogenase-like 2-hydroxyacid dehydrogenase